MGSIRKIRSEDSEDSEAYRKEHKVLHLALDKIIEYHRNHYYLDVLGGKINIISFLKEHSSMSNDVARENIRQVRDKVWTIGTRVGNLTDKEEREIDFALTELDRSCEKSVQVEYSRALTGNISFYAKLAR